MLFKKADPQGEWLVVGLGNPGSQYDLTRHNVGFDAIDYLAQKWGATVNKAKFEGLYGQAVVDGTKVLLLKPQTYMNLSGRSIQAMAAFYKIPLERVVVLCDDITQNPGKIRIRPSGSAGGHNGLKDIIARFGSDAFCRVRLGVGQKPHPEYDLANWVLGRMEGEDRKAFEARLPDIEQAVRLIMAGQLTQAQNKFNR
ncbi:aminoacyl-tRNA hydrolase [uncultured Allofournierella sp.]|uniref:aminoacyl-tRNA hydrolase n=1 Tax=uncultured Allofournierella sp. TaxID=1940258 RepID=UPI003751F16C